MNNLEWINKQILFVKQNIQYHKDLLAESDEEYADEIISVIKLLEPELQTLQQIKAELEAWYVVKEYGAITIDKDVNRITIILYISPAKEGYDKLEKALEVNNNENNNS